MGYKKIESFLEKCKKPEDYNFELEFDIKNYDEKPIFERYFIYSSCKLKKTDENIELKNKILKRNEIDKKNYSRQGDPDSWNGKCDLTNELYECLWGWKYDKDKKVSSSLFGMIPALGIYGGGDAMNSIQTTMNYCLKIIKNEAEKQKNQDYIRYRYYNLKTCLRLYCDFPKEFVEDLENIKKLADYLALCRTMGNFVLVPAGFNGDRGLSKAYDYWDSSLVWLKNSGYEKDSYKLVIDGYKGFERDAQLFNKYINYFYLWDYVCKEGDKYIVKPLFDSHSRIGDGDKKNTSVWTMIKTDSDLVQFLDNTCDFIRKRSVFMTMLLRLKKANGVWEEVCKDYFDYIQGCKFLATVHEDGYRSSVVKLKSIMKEKKISEDDPLYKNVKIALKKMDL